MMSSLLDSAVFPGTQGGPLEHVIAAKAVAFREAMTDDYFNYCLQVVKNARVMAAAFKERGYQVVSGGTDNHLMLIDLRPKNISGKEADKALVEAHITVNKNMVPFDDKSPMVTSGIRVGTAALTSRGMREEEMLRIVELMDRVITNAGNRVIIKEVQREVKQWAATYPL